MTGIALDSTDPKADHAALKAAGVDVDAELMGGDGVVPLMFFFRDQDANHADDRRGAGWLTTRL